MKWEEFMEEMGDIRVALQVLTKTAPFFAAQIDFVLPISKNLKAYSAIVEIAKELEIPVVEKGFAFSIRSEQDFPKIQLKVNQFTTKCKKLALILE